MSPVCCRCGGTAEDDRRWIAVDDVARERLVCPDCQTVEDRTTCAERLRLVATRYRREAENLHLFAEAAIRRAEDLEAEVVEQRRLLDDVEVRP